MPTCATYSNSSFSSPSRAWLTRWYILSSGFERFELCFGALWAASGIPPCLGKLSRSFPSHGMRCLTALWLIWHHQLECLWTHQWASMLSLWYRWKVFYITSHPLGINIIVIKIMVMTMLMMMKTKMKTIVSFESYTSSSSFLYSLISLCRWNKEHNVAGGGD